MKVAIRIKKFGINLTVMISQYQSLGGITSLLPNGLHMPMWDMDDCSLDECIDSLCYVQKLRDLSNIYILSDKLESYRSICYSQVNFNTFLKILIDTEHIDYGFFCDMVERMKATIRLTNKIDRPNTNVFILKSYPVPFPEKIQLVEYDTGLQKTGKLIELGDKIEE
jgi:hypothetical protein